MATVTKRGTGYQLRVTNKLLPKPFYATFDDEVQAGNYGEQLESMLAKGIVPQELLSVPKSGSDSLLIQVIVDYTKTATAVSESDDALLDFVMKDKPLIGLRLSALTYRWVESYLTWLKSPEKNLSPSSISKRIGVLGRVMAWHIKRTTTESAIPMANVLRMLPRGYSKYSANDAKTTTQRRNIERDRRLSAEEAARIEKVLAGEKRDDRERVFTDDPEFPLLYAIIVDTGMRLFEAFRLRIDSIDLEHNFIRVDGSKGHGGEIKPRLVPIKKNLREPLRRRCKGRDGLLFSYWDGAKETRVKASSKLSRRFGNLFDYAKVENFTEHDLRHEAACRWFSLRDKRGWVYSEIEVCRIMGWKDTRMALRYTSLRGEDLSSRLG